MKKYQTAVKRQIGKMAWLLAAATLTIAVVAWGTAWPRWSIGFNSIYHVFPVLGLMAFSLMWTQYMIWALRVWSGADRQKTRGFEEFSRGLVLSLILLHPGLLLFQLYHDGNGLPPHSYAGYVGAGMIGFVYLGMMSLLVFLSFELEHWLKAYPKLWQAIKLLNYVAIWAIMVHAYFLGGSFHVLWFKLVWAAYAAKLVLAMAYLHKKGQLV